MFDLGSFGEVLIIAVAVLILIGPKELPALLRTLGRWISKVRRASAALRQYFDEYLQEGEFEEYREHARKKVMKPSAKSTQNQSDGTSKKERNT